MVYDSFGRPMQELDVIQIRMGSRDILGEGVSYYVESNDGKPMLGFRANDSSKAEKLVATNWNGVNEGNP